MCLEEIPTTFSQSVPSTELYDFVDLNFARRLETAETLTPAHIRALQRFAPEATSELIGGGRAVFGGRRYPSNQIVGLGLYGPVSLADLEQVEDFYHSRGVPCQIVVSPLADRSLLDLLAPRRYRISEFNSVLIKRLDPSKLIEPADGITVERVTTDTAQLWDRVISRGFAEFGPLPENLIATFATMPDSLNFLARVNGEAAGGGMGTVLREARIAALFGTATVREFRRRGVQTALINRRLWDAAQHECEYAVVSTLPGSASQRNMERRGFRLAYTKLVMVRTWPEVGPHEPDDGH
ncbi:MAG TPA: GNAT family N-acetyltransferase [Candidatus Eisenbacteria bacterium]|nr:GNAT family N-acetyltransferase [Candidatus Eisenbacteria bacterium]